MTEVVSVQFRGRGKSYFFDPAGITASRGDLLVVETSKGLELGECTQGNHAVEDSAVVQPLRSVVRAATGDDRRVAEINRRREKEAFGIAEEKIAKHKLEMKLGFQTSRGDTLHSFKTSEDLIRYTGRLGLQASKKWYYSLQLIAYTQFARGFKSNDATVYSDILSPLNVNVSVGMDYNVVWLNKRLTGTIQMAPLAYNFRYVGRKALATRYGLKEGDHTLNDFGSECTIDLTWAFAPNVKWKTRLYGYTTYKRAELEWENTLMFQFNKYISSNVFVYPRFDDGAKRDKDHGYWQLKEYASIGFTYSF